MAYVNKQNLSDFWTNAKRYIAARDADQCDWTSVPVNASSYRFEAEPRTPVNPVIEFGFTETPPAEGEKSLTNPSTITGVDSITVTKAGKNLPQTNNLIQSPNVGLSITVNEDGVISISGSTPSNSGSYLYFFNPTQNTNFGLPKFFALGKTYTSSFSCNDANIQFVIYFHNGTSWFSSYSGNQTFTVPTNAISCMIRLFFSSGTTFNATAKIQIEEGSTATAFEPYSGVSATINLGETRYGGTLDVATGKMTITHVATTPEASTVDISSAPAALPLDYADTFGRTITSSNGTSLSVGSAGGTVVYKLATPITIDLNPQQLFSALSNSKVNTLFTDTGAISQLTYAKLAPRQEDVFRYANWHRTETAGAVTCYPVPESELHPVVNFSFTETPPASGEKGPENPSTISGSSSVFLRKTVDLLDGAVSCITENLPAGVAVNIRSGNIVEVDVSTAQSDPVYISFSHTANSNIDPAKTYKVLVELKEFTPSSTYHAVLIAARDTHLAGLLRATSDYVLFSDSVGSHSLSKDLEATPSPVAGAVLRTRFQCSAGYVGKAVYRVFLAEVLGDNIVDQKYVIPLNNTYYGGSIDLSTGLMTVTHGIHIFTGEETFFSEVTRVGSSNYYYWHVASSIFPYVSSSRIDAVCTHFVTDDTWVLASNHMYCGVANTNVNFCHETATNEEFKTFLREQYANGTPVTVVNKFANTQTVQLTPQQIKALPALDRHSPRINTLFTDADSIQVSYQKSPIQTELELTDAILALGGGE